MICRTDTFVALEEVAAGSGTQQIQVALAGSVIPAATNAANAKPGMLVKAVRDTTHGVLVDECTPAELAAGMALGRIRTQINDAKLIARVAAARGLVLVHTGVL